MRKWVERVVLGAGWCAVVVGVVGIVLHFGAWRWQVLVLVASGASYLMLGAAVGLVLFLVARGWRSAVAAGVIVAAVLWTQLPMFVPEGRAASGPEVTVMQSNLLFGEADAAAVVGAVRANNVEVLTVDELTPEVAQRLADAGITELLPHQFLQARGGGGGTGIFSRYPLRDTKKYDGFLLDNLTATMEHPQRGAVAVFAFHPVPPSVDFPAWSSELGKIREILDAQQGPAIVGADFNATRDHSAFRALLRGRFVAAADQAGAGPLLTFPADRRWGPVIGIDHILVADGTAADVRSLTIPGSDHRAVLARVQLNA
ncbi:endonuclease/exonuclease/phosphatase family protein [Nocardia sp. NBC_00565]|uniref:endonuclease/exonuclease/phosphatase family protein n=1 Tax=Nocardia sp. NBC_00565 TaxID=2975993 RepID=UPI002E806F29|nr:endonuclease/exonuclease/phosphatase family protein [Nocardia sp. NBC_00565]WUC04260.1 endonuclease/exonuclease/phosphatase family protein [Nocardia sp. NBC_00565]